MTVMALKKNNMKKRSGFKMRSGNKPDMTKLAGITKADSKQTDGRAKSSAFQAADDEFPGLVDFEVDVKGKDTTRDIMAKKAKPPGSGKSGMEQAVRSLGYKQADEALAKSGDKAAKQRLRDRASRLAKLEAAREKNPNITKAEINKIMTGN